MGTDIIMHIKADTDDEKYSEFLESWRLQELVRKYSDYIRFPIRMEVSKTRRKEGSPDDKPEYETYQEEETLNSMVPIWQRRKSSVKPEEYNAFYKEKFGDWQDPLAVIHTSAEGAVTYKAMLYIPAHAPFDFYSRDYQKGLQLYSSGVLIMDQCADLLPDHFRFVRGVVDSADFSLNISREVLQHTRQLSVIAKALEKKIKAELLKRGYDRPLVADVHFNPNVADVAAAIVEKVRINPGNYVDPARQFKHLEYTDEEYAAELARLEERFTKLLNICKAHHTALRIDRKSVV